jgi:hypothetical protein
VSLDDGEDLMLCEQCSYRYDQHALSCLLSNDGIEGSSGSSIDMVKLSSDFDYSILDFVKILIEWHSVYIIDQCMGVFKQWWQNKLTSFLPLHSTSIT